MYETVFTGILELPLHKFKIHSYQNLIGSAPIPIRDLHAIAGVSSVPRPSPPRLLHRRHPLVRNHISFLAAPPPPLASIQSPTANPNHNHNLPFLFLFIAEAKLLRQPLHPLYHHHHLCYCCPSAEPQQPPVVSATFFPHLRLCLGRHRPPLTPPSTPSTTTTTSPLPHPPLVAVPPLDVAVQSPPASINSPTTDLTTASVSSSLLTLVHSQLQPQHSPKPQHPAFFSPPNPSFFSPLLQNSNPNLDGGDHQQLSHLLRIACQI